MGLINSDSDTNVCAPLCSTTTRPSSRMTSATRLVLVCYVSSSARLPAHVLNPLRPCLLGDSKVNCGGEGLMQTFYKPTVKAKAPSATDKSYVGCHVDGTVQGTRNPDWTDVDGCRTYCGDNKKKYFGVSNSRYCFCSNELKQDSWESRVPEMECKRCHTPNDAL